MPSDALATPLPTLAAIEEAAQLIYRSMPPTPQYSWPQLSRRAGAEVWVKQENHTPVGAFKIRGGLVYMDWLRREHPEVTTVVSATRGNHGQSLAFAAAKYGLHVVIVVPEGNSVEKNRAMEALGAEVIVYGADFQASCDHAITMADERGWHRVPSYHPLLVTGVATYALELFTACPKLDTVYVPIGMGSGVSGMIAVRDALGLATKVVGVVSSHAPAMALSIANGYIVEHETATRIADGVACRRPDPLAFEVVSAGAERIVQVDDDAVEEAIRIYFADTHQIAEGAGAIGLAALLEDRPAGGDRVATVLSGGNVDSEVAGALLRRS